MQIGHAQATDLMLLQTSADILNRAEFGSIRGQEQQLESAFSLLDLNRHDTATVWSEVIPDDEQLAPDLAAPIPQELHELWSSDGTMKFPAVEQSEGHHGNGRALVLKEAELQNGSPAAGCLSTDSGRALAQSRFVEVYARENAVNPSQSREDCLWPIGSLTHQ